MWIEAAKGKEKGQQIVNRAKLKLESNLNKANKTNDLKIKNDQVEN